jgi:ATP synthase protein I
MSDDLKSFEQRLDKALDHNELDIKGGKVVDRPIDNSSAESMSGLAFGMKIGLEFMSGTLVGFLMGWGLDTYFKSTPWFLLLFTLLGFGAGMLNVYRSVNNIDEGIGINRQRTKRDGLTNDK